MTTNEELKPREYRKTATIRAAQWWQMGDHPAVEELYGPDSRLYWINTLEGPHKVIPGDWIATGVKGEHWPIKPDVFAASYEPVEVRHPSPGGETREAIARIINETVKMEWSRVAGLGGGYDLEPQSVRAAADAILALPLVPVEGAAKPIPMLLFCPECGAQHIDEPEDRDPTTNWTNPPHRSHLCHACGCVWRPADVPTEGVKDINTEGQHDTWLSNRASVACSIPTARTEAQVDPEEALAKALYELCPVGDQNVDIDGRPVWTAFLIPWETFAEYDEGAEVIRAHARRLSDADDPISHLYSGPSPTPPPAGDLNALLDAARSEASQGVGEGWDGIIRKAIHDHQYSEHEQFAISVGKGSDVPDLADFIAARLIASAPAPVGVGWSFDMDAAPRDGTPILAWCVHENHQYAQSPEEKARWTEIVPTRWIDHNGGGWTWHGICGVHRAWMPLPASPSGGEG